jgi:hypothetical protein
VSALAPIAVLQVGQRGARASSSVRLTAWRLRREGAVSCVGGASCGAQGRTRLYARTGLDWRSRARIVCHPAPSVPLGSCPCMRPLRLRQAGAPHRPRALHRPRVERSASRSPGAPAQWRPARPGARRWPSMPGRPDRSAWSSARRRDRPTI